MSLPEIDNVIFVAALAWTFLLLADFASISFPEAAILLVSDGIRSLGTRVGTRFTSLSFASFCRVLRYKHYLFVALLLKMCGLAAWSSRIGPAIILQGDHFLSKVSEIYR